MTTLAQQCHARRWVLPFLAGVIAALAAILGFTTASASAAGVAETCVGAFHVAGEVLVGPPEPVLTGQSRDAAENQPPIVGATGVATETGFNAGLDGTKLSMTRTVESHIGEYAKDGTLARPYADSRLTIQNVMDSVRPIADPGGVPGALRWDAPGSMNGSSGTWALVADPSRNTILHFMFRGAH